MDFPSVSSVRKKAADFRSSSLNEKARVLTKQAILRELNDTLQVTKSRVLSKNTIEENRPTGHQHLQQKAALDKKRKLPRARQQQQLSLKHVSAAKVTHVAENVQMHLNLPPNYDWNKKGRLIEIKIRFLARKYSNIWMRKVFGRVTPNHARKFNEINILRKSLKTWQEMWWSGRKGWKLQIRANYHDRLRLWQKAFRSWKFYVVHAKVKRDQFSRAQIFDERKSILKAWKYWQSYILQRRTKLRKKILAESFREEAVLRKQFSVWIDQLHKRRHEKELEIKALEFWARSTKLKTLQTWMNMLFLSQQQRKMLFVAGNYHSMVIKRKCFRQLSIYINNRRIKAIEKRKAITVYDTHLTHKSFCTWYNQLQRIYRHRELSEKISLLAEQNRKKRYLQVWLVYIQHRRHKMMVTNGALLHSQMRQKKWVLTRLQKAVERRQRKRLIVAKADSFSAQKSMQKQWNQWLLRAEVSEELNMYPLTKLGRSHYQKTLLHKAITGLKFNISHQKQKRDRIHLAESFFKETYLPKYFEALVDNVAVARKKRSRLLEADSFRREVLLTKYWVTWIHNHQKREEVSQLESMATAFEEEKLQRRFMTIWRGKTKILLQEREKKLLADGHSNKLLLKKAFYTLNCNRKEETRRRKTEWMAVLFNKRRLQKRIFDAWLMYSNAKKKKKHAYEGAEMFFSGKMLRSVFNAWVDLANENRGRKAEAERRYQTACTKLVTHFFDRWRESVITQKEEEKKEQSAIQQFSLTLSHKVFDNWRRYAILHSEERRQKYHYMEQYTATLALGKKRRIFLNWHYLTGERQKQRDFDNVASRHYTHALKKKVLVSWKAFMALKFRSMILSRQSATFFKRTVSKRMFVKWKLHIRFKQEEHKKSNFALWWWSSSLQRKAIHSWLVFVQRKRISKQRTSHALQFRMDYFTKIAIRRWFTFASNEMERRNIAAFKRNSELTNALSERVHKYALRWYHKTKERQTRLSSKQNTILAADKRSMISNPFETINRMPAHVSIPQTRRRLAPREPDYLRESFDLDAMHTSTQPVIDVDGDVYPRLERPMPVQPTNVLQFSGTSTLLLTSDGEESFVKEKKNQPETPSSSGTRRVLMPPSFFANKTASNKQKESPESVRFTLSRKSDHSHKHASEVAIRDSFSYSTEDTENKDSEQLLRRSDLYRAIQNFNSDLRSFSAELAELKCLKGRLQAEMATQKEEVGDDEHSESKAQEEVELNRLQEECNKRQDEIARKKTELGLRSLALQKLIGETMS